MKRVITIKSCGLVNSKATKDKQYTLITTEMGNHCYMDKKDYLIMQCMVGRTVSVDITTSSSGFTYINTITMTATNRGVR